jgi:hypothetical protein
MKRFLRVLVVFSLTTLAFSQSDEVIPGDNLVVEGVPRIPVSLVETADRYSNFRGAALDSWDPVKREMLISTRFADTNQIHLVKMPGGARTQSAAECAVWTKARRQPCCRTPRRCARNQCLRGLEIR